MEISKQQQIKRELSNIRLRLALAQYELEKLIVTGNKEKITFEILDEIIRLQIERRKLQLL